MNILRLRWDQHPPSGWQGGITSIGNFDGVHLGHRELLRVCRGLAGGLPVVVVTFDPHPVLVLQPGKYQKPLMRLADRAAALHEAGADRVVVFETSLELLSLEPLAFFETILDRQLHVQGIVEGFNFRFGRERAGDNATLQKLCAAKGIPFQEVTPFEEGNLPVSTSRVREALNQGRILEANHWLTRAYSVTGIVGAGAKRGRTIGFPTANLFQVETVLPLDGVYAGVAIHQGKRYQAAANVGPNPTFGESARKIEIHLLDFDGNLYDRPLSFEFHARLRDTMKFQSLDELVLQMKADIAQTRQIIKERT